MGRPRLRDLMGQEKARRAAQRQIEPEPKRARLEQPPASEDATQEATRRFTDGSQETVSIDELTTGFFHDHLPAETFEAGDIGAARGILRPARTRSGKETRVKFNEAEPPVHVYEWEAGPSFDHLPVPESSDDEFEEDMLSDGLSPSTANLAGGLSKLAELSPTLRLKLQLKKAGEKSLSKFNWVAAVAAAEGARIEEEYEEIDFDATAFQKSLKADDTVQLVEEQQPSDEPPRPPGFLDSISQAEHMAKQSVSAAESQRIADPVISVTPVSEETHALQEALERRLVIEAAPTSTGISAESRTERQVALEASFVEFEAAIKGEEERLQESKSLRSQVTSRNQDFANDLEGLAPEPLAERLQKLRDQVQSAVHTATAIQRASAENQTGDLPSRSDTPGASMQPTTTEDVISLGEGESDFDALIDDSEGWKTAMPAEIMSKEASLSTTTS